MCMVMILHLYVGLILLCSIIFGLGHLLLILFFRSENFLITAGWLLIIHYALLKQHHNLDAVMTQNHNQI